MAVGSERPINSTATIAPPLTRIADGDATVDVKHVAKFSVSLCRRLGSELNRVGTRQHVRNVQGCEVAPGPTFFVRTRLDFSEIDITQTCARDVAAHGPLRRRALYFFLAAKKNLTVREKATLLDSKGRSLTEC